MEKDRQKVYDIFIGGFDTYIKAHEYSNHSFSPTEEDILESINMTSGMYKINLSEEEKAYIINQIKSIHAIYQEEGAAILGDYEHDYDWYINLLRDVNFKQYYWDRYKNYLRLPDANCSSNKSYWRFWDHTWGDS